jgi:hypothetical protein
MKYMQVFDCQDMPADVKENFYRQTEEYGNDCYIRVYLKDFKNMSGIEYKEEYGYDGTDGGALYLKWLVENGATDDVVLVNLWW